MEQAIETLTGAMKQMSREINKMNVDCKKSFEKIEKYLLKILFLWILIYTYILKLFINIEKQYQQWIEWFGIW